MKKCISIVLILLCSCMTVLATEGKEDIVAEQKPIMTHILTVKDGRLMAGATEVVLNGVNLGGWLLMESWMSPVLDPKESLAHSDMIEILTHRFGKERARFLMKQYRDSFLTEEDFAQIADMGFNCVRLPFWYGDFMNETGQWHTPSPTQTEGFLRLDWAIAQCEKNGLYAILDMHGCPGGQSANHSTGSIGKAELYQKEVYQNAMEELWRAIAKRYRKNPVVAAYDIMNEPQNNQGFHGGGIYQAETTHAVQQTNHVYHRMIRAIRAVDTAHVISVEGIWSISTLPHPKTYGWSNMLYQLHLYDASKEKIGQKIKELLEARSTMGVAVYVGEYNHLENENYAADLYQQHGISRTKWTYKTVGREDNWGLYNKPMEKINIQTASYEEIKTAFGTQMRTENGFVFNQEEYKNIQ